MEAAGLKALTGSFTTRTLRAFAWNVFTLPIGGLDPANPCRGTKTSTRRCSLRHAIEREGAALPRVNLWTKTMRLFECQNCHNAVHFDNTACLNCHDSVGYIQDRFEMTALEPLGDGRWSALADRSGSYVFCGNAQHGVCNWLVRADGPSLCESCRHNRIIPDLSDPANLERWRKIELAKRYLFRSLLRWRLPMPDRMEDPSGGLAFDFKHDEINPDGSTNMVLTGHDEGAITLNIIEADDAERESRRVLMGETYRTLIGHLRHEVGHYYWDRLVRDTNQLEAFRAVFGDEREDYGEALKRHHSAGPSGDWQEAFISRYATSHPWEDFAETWAHYIHIVDALETAHAYGINVNANFQSAKQKIDARFDPYRATSAEELIRAWVPLTVAINGLNRSMGQPDLYPFVLSSPVMSKLQYIHQLIQTAALFAQRPDSDSQSLLMARAA
jgi:hypothetical protein